MAENELLSGLARFRRWHRWSRAVAGWCTHRLRSRVGGATNGATQGPNPSDDRGRHRPEVSATSPTLRTANSLA